MRWVNAESRRGVAAAVLAAALFLTPAFATDGGRDFEEPVVPPGQEELLSAMLGRGSALPNGCKFAGGGADGPVIRATYTCSTGEVIVAVVHASNGAESATQTEHFAIAVESGSAPSELTDTLASLIHSREGDFEWVWLSGDPVGDEDL